MSPGVVQRVNEHPEFKKNLNSCTAQSVVYLPTYVVLP